MHKNGYFQLIKNKVNVNKPKDLKVAKEDQRLIGLMVNRLDGQKAQWLIGLMVDRLDSERLRGFCDGLTYRRTFAILELLL